MLTPQPHLPATWTRQTARLGDSVIAAAASSSGRVSLLAMQLPAHPGATAADLQMPPADADGESLVTLPWEHKGPVASVDINGVTRVSGGRVCGRMDGGGGCVGLFHPARSKRNALLPISHP